MGRVYFIADSPLVDLTLPGLGYKRGKLQRYERGGYHALVVHTTGRGIHKKAKRWGVSGFQAAMRVFATQVDASGHYVVGQGGELGQCVPEEVAAWHVGGRGAAKYHRAGWWKARKVAWWRERWPQFTAPGQLAGGSLWLPSPTTGKPSCNANTIGVEVVPPEDPRAPWSPECWATLAKLGRDISERRAMELTLETVLTHSDAHPFSRSAKGKPWDPAPHQWSYDRFAETARLPLISGAGEPYGRSAGPTAFA